jgi:hypothetical protein
MQMKIFHPLRCSWPDCGDARAADLTSILVQLEKNVEERFYAICARENNPIVNMRVLHQLCELAQIGGRFDPDGWQFEHLRAEFTEFVT